MRHVAIRKPAVLTGTVVPGKACREASCRKSPRCEAPRFTESSSEEGTLVAQARCRDLLATRGSYPRCRTLFHPPPPSLFSVGADTHAVMQGSRESSQDLILRSYSRSRPRDNTAECVSSPLRIYSASLFHSNIV